MKKIYKTAILLLITVLSSSCLMAQKSIAETYESWPLGTSSTAYNRYMEIKESGISYLEINMNPIRGKSAEEQRAWVQLLKNKADSAGLKIWSAHLPYGKLYDITEMDNSRRAEVVKEFIWFVELAKVFNPQKFVLHASFEPIPDEERPQRLLNARGSINILNDEIRKQTKAQLLVEDLPRTCIGNTSDEILYLLEGVDKSVGVCFDTNHLLKEKPQDFVRKVGSRIASLHVSDYDAVDEKHWVMGKGIVEWTEVIKELVNTGYNGVFMFEVGGKFYTNYSELYDSWKELGDKLKTSR